MPTLFESVTVGGLALRNRLMRSATAERVADPLTGAPTARQAAMYRALAEGGIGLIVTGHAYVDRGGKPHAEMASIADDALIPLWREAIRPAQEAGACVVIQVNHAGSSCDPIVTPEPVSPSGIVTNPAVTPRVITEEEIWQVVAAFGQAARRAREAGFDGVQIHGAHGYLVSQFLTPGLNQRVDDWGGTPERRLRFLREVVAAMRRAVGADFPLWIKLGMQGAAEYGPTLAEGAQIVAACRDMGVDGVEISHGVRDPADEDRTREARYWPLAIAARAAVGDGYPLALVNGFRTGTAMEEAIAGGVVQLVSLCRPLIVEPDLPNRLLADPTYIARCVRCRRCWPEQPGEGVLCRHKWKN